MVDKRDLEIYELMKTFSFDDPADYVYDSIGYEFNLSPVTVKNIIKKQRHLKRFANAPQS
jgi:hypothetical protein